MRTKWVLVHRPLCCRALELQVGSFAALPQQFITRDPLGAAWQEAVLGQGVWGAGNRARPPPNTAPTQIAVGAGIGMS